MAARLPDGSVVSLATTYGSPITVTALSNDTPNGEATATAHGLTNGDIVSVVSGWADLNNRVVRVANKSDNTFELENIDTSSLTRYPAGSGTGTVTEITAWTQISQIMGFTTAGGDRQYVTFSFLEQDFETQIPTVTSAQSMTMDIADDPALAGYIALKTAAEAKAIRALKIAMPDGSLIFYQGYVGLNETPSVGKGQVMQVRATFSLQSRPVRYAS